jgi:hypothetical protein
MKEYEPLHSNRKKNNQKKTFITIEDKNNSNQFKLNLKNQISNKEIISLEENDKKANEKNDLVMAKNVEKIFFKMKTLESLKNLILK